MSLENVIQALKIASDFGTETVSFVSPTNREVFTIESKNSIECFTLYN